jgi:hypothetical protein
VGVLGAPMSEAPQLPLKRGAWTQDSELRVRDEIMVESEAELGVSGYAESPPCFRPSSLEIDINRSGACAIGCTRRRILTRLSVLTNLIPRKDGEGPNMF